MSATEITLVVDGVEVKAGEGEMLVDAAKGGDVEIPVFCYEPKLGGPVGACRMCLVEIEGIPKLQTACSTPVRDGMVVYTRTDRVIAAQNAVVEFLLVNHPLDCPVCDKGGECPLQDIAMGWGPGRSRMIDPKRHFRKPAPLSPLVRIDRERCILCYRCVRFSQEVAEDEQLQLLDRGAQSYVGTFDERPYIAPFHGNIIELCPVGALTSEAYRFRARPWDIEDSGSICTLCPSQCNVLFTVRDERIQRVLARDNHEVDNGWLCDKGRFGFQMISSEERITEPQLSGNRAGWEQALEVAAAKLGSARGRVAAIVGGQASNEEAYLVQRIVREALGSPHVTTLDELDGAGLAALSTPEMGASIADIDTAESVLLVGADPLHAMPILDLRLRKAVRHSNLRLVVASDRPTALDGGAEETARYLPGQQAEFLAKLAAELGDSGPSEGGDYERLAGELRPGKTLVIWGEGLGHGPDGPAALASLLEICKALDCAADGGGAFSVPSGANARGAREVGCLPTHGPGFARADAGRGLEDIKRGLHEGELDGIILVQADPVRDLPDGPGWAEALRRARTVVAVSSFGDASTKAADVVLPAEAYAEKEGTVTHPDGRLQRLRPAVPRPGLVRPVWQVLAELAAALGDETQIESAPEALAAIAQAVPFYAGLTPDEIGGTGVRWQTREAAGAFQGPLVARSSRDVRRAADANGGLRLGTYRDLWAGEVTELNPALRFLAPAQRVELAVADGERLGLADGDEVEVRSNGSSVRARVALRERMRPGAAFLIEGTAEQNANRLNGAEVVEITEGLMLPLADTTFAEATWIMIVKSIIIFLVVFMIVPVLTVVERKLIGRFQNRYGPNRVGPVGLLQPVADILKLVGKQVFRPDAALPFLYAIGPALVIFSGITTIAILPFGNVQDGVGLYGIDVPIGILYFFAFGSISFYGLLLSGWASGSKYSFLGAMRAAAQLISYEVAMGLSLLGAIMMAGSLSLVSIVEAQGEVWYIIPQIIGFLVFMVAGFAETNRAPFDLPEADAELVQGFQTEYGGTRFGAFLLAEYLEIFVVSGIAAAFFLGGWMGPGPSWLDPIWMLVKIMALILVFIWIRATLPRLRYDQLMSLGWKILLPLATLNVLVTAVLVVVA